MPEFNLIKHFTLIKFESKINVAGGKQSQGFLGISSKFSKKNRGFPIRLIKQKNKKEN